jgi:hypothetical protein
LYEPPYKEKPAQDLYVFGCVFDVGCVDTLYDNPDENAEAVLVRENTDEDAEYDE